MHQFHDSRDSMSHQAHSLSNKPLPTVVARSSLQFASRSKSLRSAQRPVELTAPAPYATLLSNEVQHGRQVLQLTNAATSNNSIGQGIRQKLPYALCFAAAIVASTLVAPNVAQAATAAAAGEGSSLVKSELRSF